MSNECILCSPQPDALIYCGDAGVVVIDGPCRPGHVLVGIRGHYPHLHSAPPDEVANMMRLAVNVSDTIVHDTGAEKTYVVAIGDKDKHFHVHLIPKMAGDPPLGPHVFGGNGWASFLPTELDAQEHSRIVQAIRTALTGR